MKTDKELPHESRRLGNALSVLPTDRQPSTKEHEEIEDTQRRVEDSLMGHSWQAVEDNHVQSLHELCALYNALPDGSDGYRQQRTLSNRLLSIILYLATSHMRGTIVLDTYSDACGETQSLFKALGNRYDTKSNTIETLSKKGRVLVKWCREFGVGILLAPVTLVYNE